MIKDGGPAFPQTNERRYEDPIHGVIRPSDVYGEAATGMTLRDYLAGQALTGLVALYSNAPATHAATAYAIADEMLAERERA